MQRFLMFIKAALLAIGALAFLACLAALAFGAFVEIVLRELS